MVHLNFSVFLVFAYHVLKPVVCRQTIFRLFVGSPARNKRLRMPGCSLTFSLSQLRNDVYAQRQRLKTNCGSLILPETTRNEILY